MHLLKFSLACHLPAFCFLSRFLSMCISLSRLILPSSHPSLLLFLFLPRLQKRPQKLLFDYLSPTISSSWRKPYPPLGLIG